MKTVANLFDNRREKPSKIVDEKLIHLKFILCSCLTEKQQIYVLQFYLVNLINLIQINRRDDR